MLPRAAVLCASALWGAAAQWEKCCTCKSMVVCERDPYFVFGGQCKEEEGRRGITVQGKDCSDFSIRQGGFGEDVATKFRKDVAKTLYTALHEAAETTKKRKESGYFTSDYKTYYKTEYKGLNTTGYTELVKNVAKDKYKEAVEKQSSLIVKPTCVFIPDDFRLHIEMEEVKSGSGEWKVGLKVPDGPDIRVKEGEVVKAEDIVKGYFDLLDLSKDRAETLAKLRQQAIMYKDYTGDYVKERNWTDFMENYDKRVREKYKTAGAIKCRILAARTRGGVKPCTSCSEMPKPEVQQRRVRGRSVRRLRTLLARILKRG